MLIASADCKAKSWLGEIVPSARAAAELKVKSIVAPVPVGVTRIVGALWASEAAVVVVPPVVVGGTMITIPPPPGTPPPGPRPKPPPPPPLPPPSPTGPVAVVVINEGVTVKRPAPRFFIVIRDVRWEAK